MGTRRRDGHAFGARVALASGQLAFRKKQTQRPATYALIRPGRTSESRECRGTVGVGRLARFARCCSAVQPMDRA
eukprot:4337779-Prymnesium_polylepis.1